VISNRGLGSITAIGDLFMEADVPVVITRVNYDAISEAVAVGKRNVAPSATKNPLIHIETSQITSPDGLKVYVGELGPERLLFGSYAPYHYTGAARKVLEKAEISDADRQKIAIHNFNRLLRRAL
jgi:predicted TIM-barrel fold metal-dependent hydrolase